MINLKEFQEIVWAHYLEIEQEFCKSISYVSLDKDNFSTFSEKYFTLYQLIGSEIDVVSKELCHLIDSTNSKCDNIHHYCKILSTKLTSLTSEKVWVRTLDQIIVPWDGWTFKVYKDKNNIEKISGVPPKWWTLYNKTKHTRTTTLSSYNKPFYKYANLENVLNSLAALFILDMYIFRELSKNLSGIDTFKSAIKESNIFILEAINSNHCPPMVEDYDFHGVKINFKN